jgi:hypothetical protein
MAGGNNSLAGFLSRINRAESSTPTCVRYLSLHRLAWAKVPGAGALLDPGGLVHDELSILRHC